MHDLLGPPAAASRGVGAVVLAGGGAVRLDGADKAAVEIAGRTLLEHALEALVDVPDVVVVGEQVPTSRPVSFVREEPPGGGPAAAVLAGLRGFPHAPAQVVVLAVDMPFVTAGTVRRLLAAATGDGARLVDRDGRRQQLCAAYSVAALRGRAGESDVHGWSMGRLLHGLAATDVPAEGEEAFDVDTWDDVRRARTLFDQ